MKYVNFTLKEMTPDQMKMNPIKPIIKVNANEKLDTEEGESTKVQEEFTTSEALTEELLHFHTFKLILCISFAVLNGFP